MSQIVELLLLLLPLFHCTTAIELENFYNFGPKFGDSHIESFESSWIDVGETRVVSSLVFMNALTVTEYISVSLLGGGIIGLVEQAHLVALLSNIRYVVPVRMCYCKIPFLPFELSPVASSSILLALAR